MCILEYCHLKNKMMKYEATGKETQSYELLQIKTQQPLDQKINSGRSSFTFGIYPTLATESVKKCNFEGLRSTQGKIHGAEIFYRLNMPR